MELILHEQAYLPGYASRSPVPLPVPVFVVLERLEDRDRYDDADRLRQVWVNAVDAPLWGGAPQWLHGDLHAANILLDSAGRLAAVIDFGDLGAGDPAVDLAAAWLVFDADGRQRFMASVGAGVDAKTWGRARGWALVLGTAMVSNSDDNPMMLASGEFALRQLLDD